MQAKDIPDDLFLEVVKYTAPPKHYDLKGWEPGKPLPATGRCPWRFRGDVQRNLELVMGRKIPERTFLAKARKLGRKGLLVGCTECTCRGDYHLATECTDICC